MVALGDSPETNIPPLIFSAVDKSQEEQLEGSTSWCNQNEARMVASAVEYLFSCWPKEWGEVGIGIAVAYHDQVPTVHCISSLLEQRESKRN